MYIKILNPFFFVADVDRNTREQYKTRNEYTHSAAQQQQPQKHIFACKLCNNLFTHERDLTQHIQRDHVNEQRSLPCSNKRSKRKDNIIERQKAVHTSESPYQCSVCRMGFKKKAKVSTHIKKVHPNTLRFKCEHCKKRFLQKADMKQHQKNVHFTERPHPCLFCEIQFMKKADLNEHVINVHYSKPTFYCDICDQKFWQQESLIGHQSSVHKSIAYELR